jgi:hypothetical protein
MDIEDELLLYQDASDNNSTMDAQHIDDHPVAAENAAGKHSLRYRVHNHINLLAYY